MALVHISTGFTSIEPLYDTDVVQIEQYFLVLTMFRLKKSSKHVIFLGS